MYTLYKLVFASGKAYIGQTARSMHLRLLQHKRSVKADSQLPVHCAWRKHGEPSVSILAEFETHEELHAAEKAAILAADTLSPNGYNVSFGGDTAPSKNPEVAAKIAAAATGRKYDDVSPWIEATTQLWKDNEYRKKVSEGLKASWTDERRAARSVLAKAVWEKRKADGYAMSEETKQKLASYERTAETRAKMSAAAKGKKKGPWSDERKAAAKARRANMTEEERTAFLEARKKAGETRRKNKELKCL